MKRHSGARRPSAARGPAAGQPLIRVMACSYVAGWRGAVTAGRHVGWAWVVPGLRGCLLCSVAGAAGVLADTGADAPPEDVLARALEANRQLARLVEELRTYPASDGLRAGIGSGILRQPTPNSVTVPRHPRRGPKL